VLPISWRGPVCDRPTTRTVGLVSFKDWVELVGKIVDAAGVALMIAGALAATLVAARRTVTRDPDAYRLYRRQLGRSILLGLELLVAADIIRTVAVTPTIRSVVVLAAIVAIRTFLSFSLELEITGRWPWQKPDGTPSAQ
jgi:uncharacterized membrane protein